MTKPDPAPLDLNDDDTLMGLLDEALSGGAPIPEAARGAALAAFDLGHLEGELALVVADSAVEGPLVGTRHDSSADRYVEIESTRLRVEIDLPAAEPLVIGQLDPPGADHVVIEFATASGGVERVDSPVDELGRFQADLRPGSMRLHFTTDSGPVATPWIVR
jgi:hypothetical protein